jgi:glycosyltransferase involved in cell wall biosynthesis
MTSTDAPVAIAVSFVVPCYNERENVAATVAEIERGVKESGIADFEIIVVDDCSNDGTSEVVKGLLTQVPQLRLVINEKNLSLGGAYKEGVKRAVKDYVMMIPGDNSHPAEGITPVLGNAGNADIVVPYPQSRDVRSSYRQYLSGGYTAMLNLLFGLNLPYYNGIALHRGDLLKSIEIKTNGFAYAAEILIRLIRRGSTFVTVAVVIRERKEGRSSALKPKNMMRVFGAILSLWVSECAPFWRKTPQLTK